jgi:ureidoacrylate peracid hydrolase
VKPFAGLLRAQGGWTISTHFTLVPGRDGEPLISPHLKALRPFLGRGDFAPGAWGHALVDLLAPADFTVEKVAYSAFYMSRLEWVLRKLLVEKLFVCGIVTNGGVTSTVRDAHIRDFEVVVLADGCAAFSPEAHETALAALRSLCKVTTVPEAVAEVMSAVSADQ